MQHREQDKKHGRSRRVLPDSQIWMLGVGELVELKERNGGEVLMEGSGDDKDVVEL